MRRWIFVLWSRLLFWAKKRTGWIDFGQDITITGTVLHQDGGTGADGDWCFELLPDDERFAQFQGLPKRALNKSEFYGCLECEVMPADRPALEPMLRQLINGSRVRVTGAWGFDGVHLGRSMWLEVPAALVGHAPNVRDGWCEIHPVKKIEIL